MESLTAKLEIENDFLRQKLYETRKERDELRKELVVLARALERRRVSVCDPIATAGLTQYPVTPALACSL